MFNSLQSKTRHGRGRITAAAWTLTLVSLIVAGLTTASATGMPTSPRTKTANLQQDVDALVAAGAPGAVLLVRDDAKTTRLTAGVAELSTQRAIAPRDHYRIASLTKTYVATVVLQLVGEGKLKLNDTIGRWVPGLVPNGDHITVKMLLNHTSGLPDHEKDPEILKPYLAGDFGYYWSATSKVKIAVAHPPLYAPGQTKVSTYSSTNYLVLGLIVNAVTGHSVGAELQQRIFKPLHLRESSYPVSKTQLPEPYAHGYFNLGDGSLTDLSAFSPSLSGAAGAIVSTVDDVAGFYRALLSGRLLKPAQLKAMKTTPRPSSNGDLGQRHGLGVERFPTACGSAWGHSGSFPGYWTHAWSSPDGKRQVVLMVNIDPSSVRSEAAAGFYKTLRDAYCGTN